MAVDPQKQSDMIREHYKRKDFTGWFDVLYEMAEGNSKAIPWARNDENPLMMEWLEREKVEGAGKTAMVVGCGLGDDAEVLAKLGFDVTAFDISARAIEWCKERFPDSSVNYQVGDLLALPDDWKHGFDLVVEAITIQALPQVLREQATRAVAQMVAPNGTLLVITFGRDNDEPTRNIPFPISREELKPILVDGLVERNFEDIAIPENSQRWFRVEYHRSE